MPETNQPPRPMSFPEAKAFPVPIGKYKGIPLDEIAETDAGLLYLDWLRGRDWIKEHKELARALAVYLDDDTIARALDKLVRPG